VPESNRLLNAISPRLPFNIALLPGRSCHCFSPRLDAPAARCGVRTRLTVLETEANRTPMQRTCWSRARLNGQSHFECCVAINIAVQQASGFPICTRQPHGGRGLRPLELDRSNRGEINRRRCVISRRAALAGYTLWQAIVRPSAPTNRSCGTSTRQRSLAIGQRGAYAQPCGRVKRLGGSPISIAPWIRFDGSGFGIAATNARV
jgi:hypothetical protein